jgi:hypothetical protein
MGRLNTLAEQWATLEWAAGYRGMQNITGAITSVSELRLLFGDDLRRYFALAALSRSTTAPNQLVKDALFWVFRVRVILEKSITDAYADMASRMGISALGLDRAPIHGFSKKQGVSIRMPLSSCVPTKLCAAACYAHDVLDAAPASVIRGAINGAIATIYQNGDAKTRTQIGNGLSRPIVRMVNAALKDARDAAMIYDRRPRIRFAHVGEFSAFPDYANYLALHVKELSHGSVDCIVYTRHPKAHRLDTSLFHVLFSLDQTSEDRRRFVPKGAKVVRSAFGGEISDTVDVNFLEHHRWSHAPPIGKGKVCPATTPKAADRTCDGCKCDFCFTR